MTTLLAYLLLVFFFATEGRTRTGREAQSFERGQYDRRSTALIGAAFSISALGLLLASLLNLLGILPILNPVSGWVGLALAALGIALRGWANRVLGRFYTRTLRVTADQPVVRDGPYRLIRHPGYLGSILMWVGAGLAASNWLAVGLAIVVMLSVYIYRIQAEEEMLVSASAEYKSYRSQTWKLIPFVF